VLLFQIPFVKNNVILFFNSLKETYLNIKSAIEIKYNAIVENENLIKSLQKENKELKFKLNQIESFLFKCNDLSLFKKVLKPELVFTETISYVKIPDFTSIYINYPEKITHPLGLVYNNIAAGIVVKNVGDYAIALLNSNKKTTYTVFVGKNEVPGIFYGSEEVIKYIPKFKDVNIGDLVITSGLDGIFYKGALVGRVIDVKEKKLYKEAKIQVFYNSLNPTFFYVVKTHKETNTSKSLNLNML